LISCEITITGSGPSSALAFQPRPYLNGTSNIAKKSAIVMRVIDSSGSAFGPPPSPLETTPALLNMTTRCAGIFDCARYVESLKGSCGAASSGCFGSAGSSGLQLSIVTV